MLVYALLQGYYRVLHTFKHSGTRRLQDLKLLFVRSIFHTSYFSVYVKNQCIMGVGRCWWCSRQVSSSGFINPDDFILMKFDTEPFIHLPVTPFIRRRAGSCSSSSDQCYTTSKPVIDISRLVDKYLNDEYKRGIIFNRFSELMIPKL